jgi:hypothetical protein
VRHLWRKGSELYRRVADYFRFKIWLPRLQDLHGARRHGFRLFRTVYFAVREFISNCCSGAISCSKGLYVACEWKNGRFL